MSNQIVISSGAKVRELEGVLTGTSGIVSSVPLGAANGVATLDSGGKVPVSQLPSSVVTYLGTWNAATNTPTLTNGTGDAGDMYICNVAGTVNFGAGPITFAVGDWVLYGSGTWQKSSGQNGTVTSVAASITGNAIGITGSPITTAGTLALAFAGTSGQYINGAGNLVTFPTIVTEAQRLVTEVYNETGATLSKGTVVYINGGHGNLPTVTKAIATSDATSAQTYGVVQTDITNMNNGYVVVVGSLMDLDTRDYPDGTQLYLSSTTAGAWTSTKQYAPAHLVYVGIVVRSHPTQGVVEVRIQNGFELDELHNVSAQTPSNNQGLFYNSSNSLWENKSIATALGYTPANDSLVVKLAGTQTITGIKTFSNGLNSDYVGVTGDITMDGSFLLKQVAYGTLQSGYTNLSGQTNGLRVGLFGGYNALLNFSASASYTYTFPNATGTIALTSDISYPVTSVFGRTGAVVAAEGDYSLTQLSDVTITSPTNGQVLKYNGTAWVNNSDTDTGITSLNGLTALTQTFAVGTSGTDFNISSATSTHTFNLPTASATNRGALSSADWTTFNNKQSALTFTSPLVNTSGTISIPAATSSVNGYLTSTDWSTFNGKIGGGGTANYIPKYSGAFSLTDSIIYDNSGKVLINTTDSSIGHRLAVYSATEAAQFRVMGGAPSVLFTDTANASFTYSAYLGVVTSVNNFFTGSAIGSLVLVNNTSNQIAFAINNSLKMTLNASGNFSIGNTNNTYKLDVSGTARFTGQIEAPTAYFSTSITTDSMYTSNEGYYVIPGGGTSLSYLSVANTTTFNGTVTASAVGFVADVVNTNTPAFTINRTSTAYNGIIKFRTSNADKWVLGTRNTSDETFRLYNYNVAADVLIFANTGAATFSSSVSVNGASNTTALNVSAAGANGINLAPDTNSPTTNSARVYFSNNSTAFAILNSSSTLAFTYGATAGSGTGTPGITMNSSGNVGIGTSSPISYGNFTSLTIASSTTTNQSAIFLINSTTSIRGSWYQNAGAQINFGTATSHPLVFDTNDTERMRITSGGNVGIGTTDPQTILNDFSSSARGLAISNTYPFVAFNDTDGGKFFVGTQANLAYLWNNGNDAMIFATNAAERMRIRGNGELVSLPTYNNTTSFGASIGIYSDGTFYRSTSSLKYKTDVQDAWYGLSDIMKLRAVTYKSKNEKDGDLQFGGLIAEEVHEAGLKEFVVYAEDNTPDALQYGNMISLVVKGTQQLKIEKDAEIANLKAQIEELKQLIK